ncbi:MAG: delta-60 repeat domain-containing protein [Spirochaetes bacterium]|nr:delta-60 repeat domain-containing protein [Spirochaetota bacterium]
MSALALLLGGGYSTGIFDDTFNNGGSGPSSTVYTLGIQRDGKVLVGGPFTQYNGTNVPDRIIRLNADGSLDTDFNIGGTGATASVYSLAIQGDGKVLIGGDFTWYNGANVPDRIIRLNTDGSVDSTFNIGGTGANDIVYTLAIQGDGKVLIGGVFTAYNGADVPDRIIRLNADGSVDSTFNNGGTGANNDVKSLVIQGDGKVLVGGHFTQYNDTDVPDGIIRLNADGSVDTDFNSVGTGANQPVYSLAIQRDGKVIIGGDFTLYNGLDVPDRIIRLNADGSVDSTFNNGGTGADGGVVTMAIQRDGKVLVGGYFTTYNGPVPDRIIRLNTDGSVDSTFNNGGTGADVSVNSLAIQRNGKVIMGGNFTTYNGTDVPDRLIRLQ